MTRRMAWKLALGLLVAVSGCGKSAAPVASPRAKVATASRTKAEPAVKVFKAKEPRFRVNPVEVELEAGDPGFQLLADTSGAGSGRRDVTAAVAWSAKPEGIVAIEAGGYLKALKSGDATVTATLDGESVSIAAKVKTLGRTIVGFRRGYRADPHAGGVQHRGLSRSARRSKWISSLVVRI